jgi:hypothetical protein
MFPLDVLDAHIYGHLSTLFFSFCLLVLEKEARFDIVAESNGGGSEV